MRGAADGPNETNSTNFRLEIYLEAPPQKGGLSISSTIFVPGVKCLEDIYPYGEGWWQEHCRRASRKTVTKNHLDSDQYVVNEYLSPARAGTLPACEAPPMVFLSDQIA